MSREGPVLRPGTRSYGRSWIRDGAMIAEGLVRLGHAQIAADYLRWFAPQPVRQRQGAVLRRLPRRRSGAGRMTATGSSFSLPRKSPLHRRPRAARMELALRRRRRSLYGYTARLRAHERHLSPDRRMAVWPAAPRSARRLFGKAAIPTGTCSGAAFGYKSAAAIAAALGRTPRARVHAGARQFRGDVRASLSLSC